MQDWKAGYLADWALADITCLQFFIIFPTIFVSDKINNKENEQLSSLTPSRRNYQFATSTK